MEDIELLEKLANSLGDYRDDVMRIMRLVKAGERTLTEDEYAEFKTLLTYTQNGI